MAIFMKIEGVDGESTAKGYEKWIDVSNIEWGTDRSGGGIGVGLTPRTSMATVTDIKVSKQQDAATPVLFSLSLRHSPKKIEIHTAAQGKDGPETYFEIVLETALVSAINVRGWDDTGPMERPRFTETITLIFEKIRVKYTPYDEEHNAGAPVPAGWDLAAGTPI